MFFEKRRSITYKTYLHFKGNYAQPFQEFTIRDKAVIFYTHEDHRKLHLR